jgi:hypothetical protein
LALGSANYVLTSDGSDAVWAASQVEESPTFTGNVAVGGTLTVTGQSTLSGLAYPTSDGSSGQVLQTNGSGTLSFATVSGTTINNNADNRIITGSGTANTLNGESGLTYDGTGLGVGISSPTYQLEVDGIGIFKKVNNAAGLAVIGGTSDEVFIDLGDSDDSNIGSIKYNNNGDYMRFLTNNAERVRIDSSGNCGIATTSPDHPLTVNGTSRHTDWMYGNANGKLYINDDIALNAGKKLYLDGGSNTYIHQAAADMMAFITDGTERIRIDDTGEFLVNRTNGFGTAGACAMFITGKSAAALYITTPNTSGYPMLTFFNGGLNVLGSITNSNNNATLYNTTSDYRLKENVDYTWDATTRLKQLKPARFNWISDETNTTVDGFLAHEVESIVPESIHGTKDATETNTNCVVNSEGNLVKSGVTEEEWTTGKEDGTFDADTTWVASHTQNAYQSIDHSKLVPLLVKTIQELEARITELENA